MQSLCFFSSFERPPYTNSPVARVADQAVHLSALAQLLLAEDCVCRRLSKDNAGRGCWLLALTQSPLGIAMAQSHLHSSPGRLSERLHLPLRRARVDGSVADHRGNYRKPANSVVIRPTTKRHVYRGFSENTFWRLFKERRVTREVGTTSRVISGIVILGDHWITAKYSDLASLRRGFVTCWDRDQLVVMPCEYAKRCLPVLFWWTADGRIRMQIYVSQGRRIMWEEPWRKRCWGCWNTFILSLTF